jgi:signal peptidase
VREDKPHVAQLPEQQGFLEPIVDLALNAVNALKCELAGEVLRSSGKLRLRVTGWSMLPAVMPGDTLVIERVSSDAVSEGDIVLFGRDRRFFVHRVITKGEPQNTELVTRGDAMRTPDPPVSERDLLGRVSFIVRNGKCLKPSQSRRFPERAVAALVQRSTFAARVVVGVHGLRQASQVRSAVPSEVRSEVPSL